jgi:aminoglycoside phosphotransferase (APT) family kinase protein
MYLFSQQRPVRKLNIGIATPAEARAMRQAKGRDDVTSAGRNTFSRRHSQSTYRMSSRDRNPEALSVPAQGDDLRARIDGYLSDRLGRPVRVSSLRRYPSGFSWITYGLTIDAPGVEGVSDLILRLGPPTGLFAPYSAASEFLALKAVEGKGVPSARALLWSDDRSIFGAPFLLSAKAAGAAPIPWGDGAAMSDARRQSLGEQFADALGVLASIDWRDTGLGALNPGVNRETSATLQIDLWEAKYLKWRLRSYPMIHRTFNWLRERQPVAPRVSIVHGDYRLGNFLEEEGRITAILDWELVHLGDPHEDLAWFCLPQYRGGSALMGKLIERAELYRRFEAKSGIRVSDELMQFYTIFSLLKLALTYLAGIAVFERGGLQDIRMAAIGTQLFPTLRQIEKALQAAA